MSITPRCVSSAQLAGLAWRDHSKRARLFQLFTAGFNGAGPLPETAPSEERAAFTFGVCYRDQASQDELFDLFSKAAQPSVGEVTIKRRSISWTLGNVSAHGTFANGDPWVCAPPGGRVEVLSQDPPCLTTGGWTRNGTMVDPDIMQPGGQLPGSRQGWDSSMYAQYAKSADYSPILNVALQYPYHARASVSLCTARSAPQADQRPQLQDMAVLTILEAPPPDGTGEGYFRPAWSSLKEPLVPCNPDRMALELLGEHPALPGMPGFQELERWIDGPWIDHCCYWFQRYAHPSSVMPDYGQFMADQLGIIALALHTKAPLEEKWPLFVRFLQLGLDWSALAKRVALWHEERGRTGLDARERGTVGVYEQPWPAGMGHHTGRKWPILFAGLILKRPDLVELTKTRGPVAFSEDDQTFFVPQDYASKHGYPQSLVGEAEYAGTEKPVDQVPLWDSSPYRRCCTFNAMYGALLAAQLTPGGREAWEHEPIFEYMKRYRREEERLHGRAQPYLVWQRNAGDWALRMWDQYAS